jgi:homoserine O-acetyltransferase
VVAAVRSDGLYLPQQQRDLHEGLLHAGRDSTWVDIDSPHGHDGFLIETAQLAPHIRDLLERSAEEHDPGAPR